MKYNKGLLRLSRLVVSALVGLLGFLSAEAIFPAVARGQTASQSVQFQLNKSAFLKILPIETAFTYNSRRPYSFNDRSFWAGKGWSSSLSLGVAFESRFLSIQIAPELYYAQNKDFTSPFGINYLYRSDLPYRLEADSFGRADLGESSVRLHLGWFELGTSSANLKWGPGVRNQMMMGEHAPGMRHIYASTRKPAKLPLNIGGISYQFAWAWPENSVYRANSRDRFISGFDIAFLPGFVSGLEVGLIRLFHSYIPDGGVTRSQIFDPFETFLKSALPDDERGDKINEGDQMASIYLAYVNSELSARIYGEYVREDHNWDFRDFTTNPHNSRGYQFGVFKWFNGNVNDHKSNLLIEVSNASGANLDQVRSLQGLYVGAVSEGHTNGGQPLGAAIGPGGTSIYVGYSQYLGWGKVGLSFEKVELAEFEYFEAHQGSYQSIDSDAHRVNLHYGVDASFNFRGFILEPRVMGIQFFNEGWDPDRDFWNWHIRLGVTYPFVKREKNREE